MARAGTAAQKSGSVRAFSEREHCFTAMETLAANEWALTANSPRPKGVGWPSHANSIEIPRQTTALAWLGPAGAIGRRRGVPGAVQCRQRVLVTVNFAYFALYPYCGRQNR